MEQLRNKIADAAYAAEDFIESSLVNQILGHSTSQDGENIISLRDLFEGSSHDGSKEADGLQIHIADAAYTAEHKTESHAEDQLLGQSRAKGDKKISSIHLYQGLQEMIEHMDSLKKEVMEIRDTIGTQDQRQRVSPPPAVSSKSPWMEKTMVGHDDVLHEILDKLTGQPSGRQIISISGMGGIGKTTLARNIYRNQLIVERFDICSWVTISQEYNIREILLEVLCQAHQGGRESLSAMTDERLREKLYKSLCGRRYLIIMDDMWSDEVWGKVKFLFPDNSNGSRILITTRLSKLTQDLSGSYGIKVDLLDEDKSWTLFCKTVFGEEDCPPELEDIGMLIARNCKGLPLSIVVIGGLLAKFRKDQEYWEYVSESLNSNVNLEENELCLKILCTSYDQLPVHLKACFLYMGIFPEDSKIHVSELIKLWVAEGFLKPLTEKSLEESAEEYLNDLIDRNLVMGSEHGFLGKLKYCIIHDLLRDLCLRQAQKEKFFCLASGISLDTSHEGIDTKRRIAIHWSTYTKKILRSLEPQLATRSLICYPMVALPVVKFRMLRVLKKFYTPVDRRKTRYSLEDIFKLVNLKYLDINTYDFPSSKPSSPSFWNLQTLIIHEFFNNGVVPPEIWKMHHIRHVKFGQRHVLDPPTFSQTEGQNDIILESLQTLVGIKNFQCSEEMVKRIPNIKKLVIYYDHFHKREVGSDHCLNNLILLHKLESLRCYFNSECGPCRDDLLHNLSFPNSLKKLTLRASLLYWEDINTKIGSLPLLQVLKLEYSSVVGPEWETIEGKFPNLKYLLIASCGDLECWTAQSIPFPCLEHLFLKGLGKLKEIPSGVGEIPTLESIHLNDCSDSAIISVKKILDEQEDLGNEGLHVRVSLGKDNDQHLRSLASHYFQVAGHKKLSPFRAYALATRAAFALSNYFGLPPPRFSPNR